MNSLNYPTDKNAFARLRENGMHWPRSFSYTAFKNPNDMSAKLDVLFHFAFWIVVLIFEILFFQKCDDWNNPVDETTPAVNKVPFQYAMAALSLVAASMGIQLTVTFAQYFKLMTPLEHKLDAYVASCIVGSLKASLILTLIVVLFATDITASTVTDEWRTRSIILVTFKVLLVQHVGYNQDLGE